MLCPVMVLYALGYSYSPGAEKSFVKTGLIFVATMPPGATVELNGRLLPQKTPVQARDLLPGFYPVTVELKGHRPWSAVVPVEKEKATVLEKILLVETPAPTEKVLPGPFDKLVPVEGVPFFLLSKGDRAGDLYVFDWRTEGVHPLLPEASVFNASKVVSIFSSKDSPYLLIWVRVRDQADAFLWAKVSAAETEVSDLTNLFLEKPERVAWSPEDKDVLVQYQQGFLNRVHVPSSAVNPKFAEGVRGFGLGGHKIYVLGDDRVLRRFGEEGRAEETVIDDAFLRPLFAEGVFYRILPLSKGNVLFWGADGSLLVNRFPYSIVERGVLGAEPEPATEKILVWTRDRVGVLDLARPSGPKIAWIYRSGRRITEAWWVYEGSHVLFRDAGRFLLLEVPEAGRPHLDELVRDSRRETDAFYSDETGDAFYLDAEKGDLFKTRVWARPPLLTLPGRGTAEKPEARDARL